MTVRARLVDVAAGGEQLVGVLRLGRADGAFAAFDQLLRSRHPFAPILRPRHHHQQVAGFGQRHGMIADGRPFLVGLGTDPSVRSLAMTVRTESQISSAVGSMVACIRSLLSATGLKGGGCGPPLQAERRQRLTTEAQRHRAIFFRFCSVCSDYRWLVTQWFAYSSPTLRQYDAAPPRIPMGLGRRRVCSGSSSRSSPQSWRFPSPISADLRQRRRRRGARGRDRPRFHVPAVR